MDPNENWVSFCVNDRVSARFHDQDWWFDATITDILSSGTPTLLISWYGLVLGSFCSFFFEGSKKKENKLGKS